MVEEEKKNDKKSEGRVETGIPGFDELIEGGLPQGSIMIVTGGPGAGKTIFALQYLAYGIINNFETALFISAEQPKWEIMEQAKQFGWNFEQMEAEGKLKIIALDSQELFDLNKLHELKQLIQNNHYDRVVLDSVSSFSWSTNTPSGIADAIERGITSATFQDISRANAIYLIDLLKQTRKTTLVLAQKIEGLPGETMDHFSEFRADALTELGIVEVGDEISRTIQVKKMRKTNANLLTHTFVFTNKGLSVKRKEV